MTKEKAKLTSEIKVQNALICLPDISGFTEFMSQTDIGLSHKVIPSLLNEIIYANTIGLKVSEIEGDAVLFYTLDTLPELKELIIQCQNFYHQFYQRLAKLMKKYRNEDDSFNIVSMLGLKIVMHYGEVGVNRIGKRIKLIGEDVIVAHRLLKNSIETDEYVLLSKPLLEYYHQRDKDQLNKVVQDSDLKDGSDRYEHIGKLEYKYLLVDQVDD